MLAPNVEASRSYGWRGSCPAGDVTGVVVGSGDWFGILKKRPPIS